MRAVIAPEPGGPEALVVADLPDPDPGPRRGGHRHVAPPRSTAPTPCSGRASTRRRRAPPTCSASSAAGTVGAVGDGRRRLGGRATRCARCSPAAGTPRRCSSPPGQVMPVPGRRRPGHRRRAARGRLHGVVQRVHDRRPAARARRCSCTAAPAASAPSRSSSRTPLGRPGAHHGRLPGEARRVPRRSAPTWRSTTASRTSSRRSQAPPTARGADVILDNMGAKYLARNVDALADRGPAGGHRHAGRQPRPSSTSACCCASAARSSPPRCAPGRSRRRPRSAPPSSSTCGRWSPRARCGPLVHATLPLERGGEAHRIMEAGDHIGKIVLTA